MPTAILYARFSSSRQQEGDSLRRQVERAEEFCKLHNLELSDLRYQDLGISAWKNVKREGLETLIEHIESGEIASDSFILVEAADRLSRQGFNHLLPLVIRLVNTGCKLVTLENGCIYNQTNINQLSSALPLIISADLAQNESQRKSERVKAAYTAQRKERILKSSQPFWIDLIDGKPVLNDRAVLARRIVDLRLAGKSLMVIAQTFNQEQIKSPRGSVWQTATVRLICRNTALYGTKTYKENRKDIVEQVAGIYPAVCTLKEFQMIKPREGVKGRVLKGAFSTLLKCHHCGKNLVSYVDKNGTKYRICSAYLTKACPEKGHYRNIEQVLLQYFFKNFDIPENKTVDPQIELDTQRITELTQTLIDLEQLRRESQSKPKILKRIYEDMDKAENELELLESKNEAKRNQSDIAELKKLGDIDHDPERQNTILKKYVRIIRCQKLTPYIMNVKIYMLAAPTEDSYMEMNIEQGRGKRNKLLITLFPGTDVEITTDYSQ